MRKLFIFSIVFFSFISFHIFGQTWSALKRLTWNSGNSWSPSIASDSGNGIHVVWADDTPPNREIFYKQSMDSGTSWSSLKRLTWNPGISFSPSIATGAGNSVYLVWSDSSPGNSEVYYKLSTDSGSIWSAPKRLTWNSGDSNAPIIATDASGVIHVVWHDWTPSFAEIFYKRSTNGGVNWSALKRMTWNTNDSLFPYIATDSGNGIHVVWSEYIPGLGNNEIFYKRSTDSGVTWSSLTRMSWSSGSSKYPFIAADPGGGIHVAWQDHTPGNGEIFYKLSTDGGTTWSGLKRLTWNTGDSSRPSIAADSGSGIHVAWLDYSVGSGEILYKFSSNGGISWSGLTRVTWNGGGDPSIAADSGNGIHLVWENSNFGNYEIFYKNRK